jgi:hypothetical protein
MVMKLNSRMSTKIIWLKIQWLVEVNVLNFQSQNIVFYLMGW